MKRVVTVLTFIGLIMGIGIAAVAASDPVARVRIPFAFHAGEQVMPAGEYWIGMPQSGSLARGAMLKIASLDGSLCQNLLSRPEAGSVADSDWRVTFSKVGDQYFLAGMRNSETGAQLAKSRAEKLFAREYGAGGEPTAIHLRAHAPKNK